MINPAKDFPKRLFVKRHTARVGTEILDILTWGTDTEVCIAYIRGDLVDKIRKRLREVTILYGKLQIENCELKRTIREGGQYGIREQIEGRKPAGL